MSDPILVDDFTTLEDWTTFAPQTGSPRLSSRYVKHSGGSLYLPPDGGSIRLTRPLDNTEPGELYTGLVWVYGTEQAASWAIAVIDIADQSEGGQTHRIMGTSSTGGLVGWTRLTFTWTQPDWEECWLRISRGANNSAQRESWWCNLRVLPADQEEL